MCREQMKSNETGLVGSRRISGHKGGPPLHRIAMVMQQEGLSPRTMAKRLARTQAEICADADPASDLRLSQLYAWQAAMNVPLIDLLVEPGLALSRPLFIRGGLLKAMRTVKSIQERATDDAIQRLALRLVEQLMKVMPELSEVPAWHATGQRRTRDELGAIVENQIPDEIFNNHWTDV